MLLGLGASQLLIDLLQRLSLHNDPLIEGNIPCSLLVKNVDYNWEKKF